MSDLLTSIDETCGFLKIQDKALRSLLALGLPVRIINGRYYAHASVLDEWLRWFLNPAVSGGTVEVDTMTTVRASGARSPRPPAKETTVKAPKPETRRKSGPKKPLRWSKPT